MSSLLPFILENFRCIAQPGSQTVKLDDLMELAFCPTFLVVRTLV